VANQEFFVEQHKGYNIYVVPDDMPESPREWDNLGTMVCWHRDYVLGDKEEYVLGRPLKHWIRENVRVFVQDIERSGGIVLPLYLYDHSNLAMSTKPFSCPWDSGQVGFIYVHADTIRREYKKKRISAKLRAQVTEQLEGEVAIYDTYLRGDDVHGFVVESDDGEELDSCWGFYGYEYCLSQAREAAFWLWYQCRLTEIAERPELHMPKSVGGRELTEYDKRKVEEEHELWIRVHCEQLTLGVVA